MFYLPMYTLPTYFSAVRTYFIMFYFFRSRGPCDEWNGKAMVQATHNRQRLSGFKLVNETINLKKCWCKKSDTTVFDTKDKNLDLTSYG